ncbi:MAG: 3-oxoacyl-ACP reductase FabG [Clostridia bacterium]|nr:3-oxoacyl-ACP reductase FabG [Clostridia bacterium]
MKKVIITGGSRGIGEACVRRFAAEGCGVAFIYKSAAERAARLAEDTGAYAVCGDVCDPESAKKAIEKAIERLGGVDVLVNNAGISSFKLFDEISEDEWRSVIETNLGGAYRCSREVCPHLIRQKSGVIINLSSMWGITGASMEVHYSASKAGVIGLTKALAKELGPSGVRVNCIAPGAIATEMNSSLDGDAIAAICDETPLGRMGTPQEVASAVYFLASDEAAFITGQVLSVDGGYVI